MDKTTKITLAGTVDTTRTDREGVQIITWHCETDAEFYYVENRKHFSAGWTQILKDEWALQARLENGIWEITRPMTRQEICEFIDVCPWTVYPVEENAPRPVWLEWEE